MFWENIQKCARKVVLQIQSEIQSEDYHLQPLLHYCYLPSNRKRVIFLHCICRPNAPSRYAAAVRYGQVFCTAGAREDAGSRIDRCADLYVSGLALSRRVHVAYGARAVPIHVCHDAHVAWQHTRTQQCDAPRLQTGAAFTSIGWRGELEQRAERRRSADLVVILARDGPVSPLTAIALVAGGRS